MACGRPKTMKMHRTVERWLPPPYQGGGQGEVESAQDEPHRSTSPSPSLVRRGIFEGGPRTQRTRISEHSCVELKNSISMRLPMDDTCGDSLWQTSVSSVSPLEIRDANHLAALTLTLSRAGSGTERGELVFHRLRARAAHEHSVVIDPRLSQLGSATARRSCRSAPNGCPPLRRG